MRCLASLSTRYELQYVLARDDFVRRECQLSAFQYAGRENDGNGLYYYRARYYSPRMGRFLSEDPIGFAGGQANLYTTAVRLKVEENQLVGIFGEIGVLVDGLKYA